MIWQKLSKSTLKSWLFYIHGRYIWYVKGCKFSTSTHENYWIGKNIISALCGYFYGSCGPKTHSEIVHISKNVLKTLKYMTKSATLVSGLRDIATSSNQGGGLHGFAGFSENFCYMNSFWAIKRSPEAIKISTDSWDLHLHDLIYHVSRSGIFGYHAVMPYSPIAQKTCAGHVVKSHASLI